MTRGGAARRPGDRVVVADARAGAGAVPHEPGGRHRGAQAGFPHHGLLYPALELGAGAWLQGVPEDDRPGQPGDGAGGWWCPMVPDQPLMSS